MPEAGLPNLPRAGSISHRAIFMRKTCDTRKALTASMTLRKGHKLAQTMHFAHNSGVFQAMLKCVILPFTDVLVIIVASRSCAFFFRRVGRICYMNVASLQSIAQALDEQLNELDNHKRRLLQKHGEVKACHQEMNDLVLAGSSRLTEAAKKLDTLIKALRKEKQTAAAALTTAIYVYETGRAATAHYAIRGPSSDGLGDMANSVDEAGVEGLAQALATATTTIAQQRDAVQAFVAENCEVEAELAYLANDLGPILQQLAAGIEVEATLSRLNADAAVPLVRRDVLIDELRHIRQQWETRQREVLVADILRDYDEIGDQIRWLSALEALEPEHQAFYKSLDPDDFEPSLELLARSRVALAQCQVAAATGLERLNRTINETKQEAYALLERLHDAIPEVAPLRETLLQHELVPERELPDYHVRLKRALESASPAGTLALRRYREKAQLRPDFAFSRLEDLWQIGAALLAVADDPNEYRGSLWTTGEDVLLRAISDPAFDVDGFYQEFGYPVVVRALSAAAQRNEVVRSLGFLNHYLPPQSASAEETLLADAGICRALASAAEAGQLWLDKPDAAALSDTELRTSLVFLSHANRRALPGRIKLQWLAMLHDSLEESTPLRSKVDALLLDALMETEQWLLLYYALMTLGAEHPELWRQPRFHALPRPLVERALRHGEHGQGLLCELAQSESVQRLAEDDEGCQFLLASLRHRLAVDTNDPALINAAWTAWSTVLAEDSALKTLLLHELDGKRFPAHLWADKRELEETYDDKRVQLTTRVTTMPGLRGVRTAIAIFRWYQDNYWVSWLQRLDETRNPLAEVRILQVEVDALAREKDLVEFSPANNEPPPGSDMANPLHSGLQVQVNKLLRDIVELFQEVAKLREQLLTIAAVDLPPLERLAQEVRELARDDGQAWAIEQLLSPTLPILNQLNGEQDR